MTSTHFINTPSARLNSFPAKLHKILSHPKFRNIILWLPHGRSWRIIQPEVFEREVIPLFYRHRKLASFMRQVNGWGFRRMNQGPDRGSYYHEVRRRQTQIFSLPGLDETLIFNFF